MKVNEESRMTNLLKRRLKSTRGTVMLEFAFVAPLAVSMIVFAADFTRILRTEQQLEIASRLAADVEAHSADYYANGKSPSSAAKNVAKHYLVDLAHVAAKTGDVYMKGGCDRVNNPITWAAGKIADFFNGQAFSESGVFWNLVGKILGGIVNFVTFRTINYITDVAPHDRVVKVTTAAYIDTILPSDAYSFFGLPERGGGNGRIGVGQFDYDITYGTGTTAWHMKLDPKKRHRVYCYMPVVDGVPVAPETYVRKFKSWCEKSPFLKKFFN